MIERLPEKVAIDILAKAYLTSLPEDDGILVWSDYGGCNPLRTVVPLVCRSWNRLVQSPAAARVFFKRVRIVDASILPLRKFRADAMLRWFQDRAQPYVQVRASGRPGCSGWGWWPVRTVLGGAPERGTVSSARPPQAGDFLVAYRTSWRYIQMHVQTCLG